MVRLVVCLISTVTGAICFIIIVVRAGSGLVCSSSPLEGKINCPKTGAPGSVWPKTGAGQSDMAKTLSAHPFWDRIFANAHIYL